MFTNDPLLNLSDGSIIDNYDIINQANELYKESGGDIDALKNMASNLTNIGNSASATGSSAGAQVNAPATESDMKKYLIPGGAGLAAGIATKKILKKSNLVSAAVGVATGIGTHLIVNRAKEEIK